jgi:hypothetical protein
MEAFVRLPGGRSTEFYLAQIDAEHAGKTMVIKLRDPGDTGQRNSANASSCNGRSGTAVSSVTTNTGGSSRYNGCWLTIEIALPTNYTAPHPATDSVTNEGGW